MEVSKPASLGAAQEVELAFRHAVAEHQAGRLDSARRIYLAVLEAQPQHAVANHNLGAIAVQLSQPDVALPHFVAALEADPAQAQYWVSYIDALCRAGQDGDARQVLALARQQGLQGEAADELARRLERAGAGRPPPAAAGKAGPGQGSAPTQGEIEAVLALFNGGRLDEAASRARSLAAACPGHWFGWKMLGVVLQRLGRVAEALAPMRRAVELAPGDAEAGVNLGIVLNALGRHDEAVAVLRQVLALDSGLALAHGNLGASLHGLGRFDEAQASYRRALQLQPAYATARIGLGAALHELGRLEEAEASHREALRLVPDQPQALRNLAITLKAAGRLDEAAASLRHALRIAPGLDGAERDLGDILHAMGRIDEACACYRHALEIRPDDVEACCNLGVACRDLADLPAAEASLRRALEIRPDHPQALGILGITLMDQGRMDAAEDCLRRALEIAPETAELHANLGAVLNGRGRVDDAVACYRRALGIRPDYAHAHSNLLHCLTLQATMDPESLFAEHVRFGERFEAPLRDCRAPFDRSREAARPLRVGMVSGDFRDHAIAYFVEPVLAGLARDRGLSLCAYAGHVVDDGVTRRLRGYFGQWRSIVGMSDAVLAETIRADGIDILIDLSGHTGKNRLLAFARKPAPVQASWMGYPGTTGLRAMDYYLGDRLFLPPGRFDGQFTEKIVRLPASAPFLPSGNAPPVNRLPALEGGKLTFGSFNRLNKLGVPVIALWARILRAVPGARMLVGGLRDEDEYRVVADWFAGEGIGHGRLEFHPRCGMESYLALHHRVDLCLDTFPYNGATTTLHALWMGVPTMNLAGRTAAGHTGASILGQLGLGEFVAYDAEEFVAASLSWATRLDELAAIRAGLRARFAASAPGQPELIAAALGRALRVMWERWCGGLPAESFEIGRDDLYGMEQGATG